MTKHYGEGAPQVPRKFNPEVTALAQAARSANWQLRYDLLARLQEAQLIPGPLAVEQPVQQTPIERSVGALGFTAQQQQTPAALGREATESTFLDGTSVEAAAADAVDGFERLLRQEAPQDPAIVQAVPTEPASQLGAGAPLISEADRLAADARQTIAQLTEASRPLFTPDINTPEDVHA